MSDKDSIYARWLEGDLTPSEEQDLKASGEWAELEAIIASTENLKLPAYNKDRSYKTLTADLVRKKGRVLPIRRMLSIAASLALFISAFFIYQNKKFSYQAGNGENYAYEFPDKSQIILNDGSSFSYKERKYSKKRTIELTGEAYFSVEEGAPFIVNTPNGTVEVLGTSFNVRAWGNKFYVKCNTGKVKVSSGSNNTILTKGMAVNLLSDNRMENIDGLDDSMPSWMSDRSAFHNEDITSVLDELSRQFDTNISYPQDLNLAQGLSREFSGYFTHSNLQEALDMVCMPMGLKYELSEDGKKISIK